MLHQLNLDGWETLESRLEASALIVEAKYIPVPTACPTCGGGRIASYGKPYPYTVVDLPHADRPVLLVVHRRRYNCKRKCPNFKQPLPDVVEPRNGSRIAKHNMTLRALAAIENRALRHTSPDIARDFGIAAPIVDQIRTALIRDLDRGYVMRAPFWLGIDEKTIAGRKRTVLTDLGRRPARVIDVLADDHKPTLVHWLTNVVPNPWHIQAVTIDAREGYRHAVYEALGSGVKLILDRAHAAIAAARPKRDPTNVPAWKRLHAIWDLPDPTSAAAAFDEWVASLNKAEAENFKEFRHRWRDWRTEMLAYFEGRLTNAGAESKNNRIELLSRSGQASSFETIRARAIFGDCRPHIDLIRCDGNDCTAWGRDGTMTAVFGPDETSWRQLCRKCHPELGASGSGPLVGISEMPRVKTTSRRKTKTSFRTQSL